MPIYTHEIRPDGIYKVKYNGEWINAKWIDVEENWWVNDFPVALKDHNFSEIGNKISDLNGNCKLI